MRTTSCLIYVTGICLTLFASQAHALSAECGNGCSSDPDAADHVHCTSWKPTNDVNNLGGHCQAIKFCLVGSCSTTIYSKSELGITSQNAGYQEVGREPVARVCVTGPANLVRIDTGKGTPSIDVGGLVNPGGGSESMCCGSCNPGGTVCQNCAGMSPMTSGCAGIIKSCPENTSEVIDEHGTGTCSGPN
jgi:hypothetical protein